MPDFSSIRNIMNVDKKLTGLELARAIRFSIAAEYEAVQIYEQIIENIDDKEIIIVIKDIIEEEKVHAGQFLEVLFRIDPEEQKKYDEGSRENRKIRQ